MLHYFTRFRHAKFAASAPLTAKLKIFVSYSRRDRLFVDQLVQSLSRYELDVLIDTRSLPTLEDWQRELLSLIREADAVVYVVSRASLSSPVCNWEVAQVAELKKRLAPIVIEPLSDISVPLPASIGRVNFLFFDDLVDIDREVAVLVSALKTDLPWVKEHTRLAERARLWNERNRPASLLIRGEELDDANTWLSHRTKDKPEPTPIHNEFIASSRKAARRRTQINWISSIFVLAMLTGGAWLTGVSFQQRKRITSSSQEASIADAKRLSLLSHQKSESGNQQAAIKLAFEASHRVDGSASSEVFGAMHHAVARTTKPVFCKANQELQKAAFLPPTNRIVASFADNSLGMLDEHCSTLPTSYSHSDVIADFTVAANGSDIVSVSWDKTAAFIDVTVQGKVTKTSLIDRPLAVHRSDTSSKVLILSKRAATVLDARTQSQAARWSTENGTILGGALCDGGPNVVVLEGDKLSVRRLSEGAQDVSFGEVDDSNYTDADFSADCTRFALYGSSGPGSICDVKKLECRNKVGGDYARAAKFAPNGTVVAVAHTKVVELVDVETGRSIATLSVSNKEVQAIAFSPDSSRLLAVNRSGSVAVFDTSTWGSIGSYEVSGSGPHSLAWKSDSSRFMVTSNQGVWSWPVFRTWPELRAAACGEMTAVEEKSCK